MGTLNKIPKTGTYGTAVDAMNDNFTLIEQSLAEGYSPYQVWLDQGNEGSEQDFLDSLKGADGHDGVVLDPEAVTIFDSPSDLVGKTSAQLASMVPSGEAFGMVRVPVDLSHINESGIYSSSGKNWTTSQKSTFLPVRSGEIYEITPATGRSLVMVALKAITFKNNTSYASNIATGYSDRVVSGEMVRVEVPSDCIVLCIQTSYSGTYDPPTVVRLEQSLPYGEPAAGSHKAVTADGVYKLTARHGGLEFYADYKPLMLSVDNVWTASNANRGIRVYMVDGGDYIHIKANDSLPSYFGFLAALGTRAIGTSPTATSTRMALAPGEEMDVVAPTGTVYMWVYKESENGTNFPAELFRYATGASDEETRTIAPLMAFGDINSSGEFDNSQASFEAGDKIATPRFIKTSASFSLTASLTGSIMVCHYAVDFSFIGSQILTYATAGAQLEITNDAAYVKLIFQSGTAYQRPMVELTGVFPEDWDTFNPRPSNGYHRLAVMVDVSDAQCSDDTTGSVQDELDLRPNYGVIALPTSYSNTGAATRLIIYCHGAGTHFTFANSTGFDTDKHVDPAYWLAEGYAVMDVDGNPMDTDAHAFRPQAMNAYIAAYKWAIEHYNLRRDGVLLGGRSMGAGTTMYLLRSTCPIPVIAACANHPTSVAMNKNAADKLLIANMRGFVLPEGFTFTDGRLTDEETQVFVNNWDKGIRYTPSIALCVDTPTTDEWRWDFIKNCCHVGEPYETNRIAACKGLHMVVRSPLKMFGCYEDPNNGYQATAQLYMTMLGNAGQQAEYRLFHSDKATNYPSDSRTEHYYELADPTLRTTVTTIYGETMNNVPVVYVEMLQFWRRYEQGL